MVYEIISLITGQIGQYNPPKNPKQPGALFSLLNWNEAESFRNLGHLKRFGRKETQKNTTTAELRHETRTAPKMHLGMKQHIFQCLVTFPCFRVFLFEVDLCSGVSAIFPLEIKKKIASWKITHKAAFLKRYAPTKCKKYIIWFPTEIEEIELFLFSNKWIGGAKHLSVGLVHIPLVYCFFLVASFQGRCSLPHPTTLYHNKSATNPLGGGPTTARMLRNQSGGGLELQLWTQFMYPLVLEKTLLLVRGFGTWGVFSGAGKHRALLGRTGALGYDGNMYP